LVRVLLERGHRVRVLTRRGDSAVASQLRSLGAEIWRGFNPWNLPALAAGIFPSPVSVRRPLQQVAIVDVAVFTRTVLERPGEFFGRRVEIASDELSASTAAHVLSRALGRHFEAQRVSLASLPDGLARLFDWLERTGEEVDLATLHARYPEVGWHSFKRWAEAQGQELFANPGRAA
jgi:uncharacterized protein YbjT (DUF2867 family)